MKTMKKINKFIYLETSKIKHICDIFYDFNNPNCQIKDGNWDIENLNKIEDSIIYSSIKDIFINNKKWSETSLYNFIKNGIESGNFKWNCDTIESLEKREEYLKRLYLSIKENGLLENQDDISNIFKMNPDQIENDDLMVALDRNGNPLFVQNGSHRLSICKILGIKKIPVRVYVRHTEWEKKRDYIFNECNKFWGGKTYQQIPHPDFDEIETIWSDNRYELFKSNTDSKVGDSILDIGSLFGYICYRSELDGYNATACEIDENYLNIMYRLHKGYNMKYKIISSSFLDLETIEYDVIIALNILHHFLKRSYEFNKLEKFLEKCKFNEMFVQFHEQGEAQMIGSYKDFSPEEFSDFIMKKTNKKNCLFIGEEMNRKIYKIY
jgi:hypothetical protein